MTSQRPLINVTNMPTNPGLTKTLIVLALGLLVSATVTAVSSVPTTIMPPHAPQGAMELMLSAKLFISTFNVVLLVVLLYNYASIYRDLPNRFTLSLTLVTIALLFYAISSNPLLPLLMGFHHDPMLGPFTFLPDFFATLAIIILLYQSYS